MRLDIRFLKSAYDVVNSGLWALAAVSSAWLITSAPTIDSARVELQSQHMEEMNEENRALCQELGLLPGTARHARCIDQLSELRKKDREQTLAQTADLL